MVHPFLSFFGGAGWGTAPRPAQAGARSQVLQDPGAQAAAPRPGQVTASRRGPRGGHTPRSRSGPAVSPWTEGLYLGLLLEGRLRAPQPGLRSVVAGDPQSCAERERRPCARLAVGCWAVVLTGQEPPPVP